MKDFNEIIKYVLSKEPKLTGTGINAGYSYEDDPIPEEEFRYCLQWLDLQKVKSTISKSVSSYSHKHSAEKWVEDTYGYHKYISNGAMIAAIIYRGIKYRKAKGAPNIHAAIKVVTKRRNDDGLPAGFVLSLI